jgi:hypothetical protein
MEGSQLPGKGVNAASNSTGGQIAEAGMKSLLIIHLFNENGQILFCIGQGFLVFPKVLKKSQKRNSLLE